jgi:hypothetical protein
MMMMFGHSFIVDLAEAGCWLLVTHKSFMHSQLFELFGCGPILCGPRRKGKRPLTWELVIVTHKEAQ